jgi:hypothetical protein
MSSRAVLTRIVSSPKRGRQGLPAGGGFGVGQNMTKGPSAQFRDVLADRTRVLGPDHPCTLNNQDQLALWEGSAPWGRHGPEGQRKAVGARRVREGQPTVASFVT